MKNQLVTKVQSFYKDELIYYPQHFPKTGDVNQVYFPYCNHILDVDGFMSWFMTLTSESEVKDVFDFLFNKDKPVVLNLLKDNQMYTEILT